MRFTCEQVRLHLTHLLTFHLRYATEQKRPQLTKKNNRRTKHSFTIFLVLLTPASSCKMMVTTRTVSLVALVNLQITVTVANLSKQER